MWNTGFWASMMMHSNGRISEHNDPWSKPGATVLGGSTAVLVSLLLTTAPDALAGAPASPPVAALFAFELDDTSLQGEMRGPDAGDLARSRRLDQQLRDALAGSGRYTPLAVATDPAVPS